MRVMLFFTSGLSLRQWKEIGMYDREVAIYRRLVDQGHEVSFLTYGGSDDLSFLEDLNGIHVLCNRFGLPLRLYKALIPWIHGREISRADCLKTNQTDGGLVALKCAKKYGMPLIARCGYMLSDTRTRTYGESAPATKSSLEMERELFGEASRIVVTTDAMRDDIQRRIPECAEKTRVIPNYVDTDIFSPAEHLPDNRRLCFVSQLKQRQKNPMALVEAVSGLDVDLEIIGRDGGDAGMIKNAAAGNPRIKFTDSVPNNDLPKRLRAARVFVLPSFYEGHPKALIEAMACGLAVVTTDVPGINNMVKHAETGLLCEPTAESLRAGIERVLNDTSFCERLGANARKFVQKNYALSKIVQTEIDLYRSILGE